MYVIYTVVDRTVKQFKIVRVALNTPVLQRVAVSANS